MKIALLTIFLIFLPLSFIYAYFSVIGKSNSSFEQNPLIYINKTIVFSGMLSICLSLFLSLMRKRRVRALEKFFSSIKYFGLFGFFLVSIHAVISLIIMNATNFPDLYESDGTINLEGQFSIMFGVISFGIFLLPAITSFNQVSKAINPEKLSNIRNLSYFGLISIMFHNVFTGYNQWTDFTNWNSLFPMTLVSFIICSLVLLFKIISPKKK